MSIIRKIFKDKSSPQQSQQSIGTKQFTTPIDGWFLSAPTSFWKDKFAHQINLIREKVRMSNTHRNIYYEPVLEAIISFYQALPASEYNHHSHSGGMIEHTLDVMNTALIYKLNFFYSESGKETDVENESDVFAYACFIACALHDIGKIVTDLDVVYKPIGSEKVKVWYPLIEALPLNCHYKYRYNPLRQHKTHVLASPTMFTHIVPPEGIIWIKSYPKLFQFLINTLAGNYKAGGEIAQVLQFSDQDSASRSMLEGTNIEAKREANAPYSKGKKSTADIIVSMIRLAIESNEVRVNVAGGAVWVVDDKIYAVSKVIIDKARSMAAQAGYTALPENTVALFSMLCDAGYCERHPITNDIIHTIHITMPNSASEAWKSQLTFLVFKREALDPNNTLNLANANAILKDNTAKDGYKAKKSASETGEEHKAESTPITETKKESETAANPFTLDHSSLFSQTTNKPQPETKPLSEVIKSSHSTITVPTQKPAKKTNPSKSNDAEAKTLQPETKSTELNLNPFYSAKLEPKKAQAQATGKGEQGASESGHEAKTTKSKNNSKDSNVETVKSTGTNTDRSNGSYDGSKENLQKQLSKPKSSKLFIPSYPTTEKQSPPNPFSKTLKGNMSLQMFMTSKNMDEQKEFALSNTPNAKEFSEWIKGSIEEKVLTYNMLHRYSEVYFIQEGVFICMPNLIHTYNKQQNKRIDSSSMINALTKERAVHIGTTKIRTMLMKKRELKGLVLKYELFNDWLVSNNIKIIESNKYVIVA
ncbi:MobH family relaxase [Vibrio gangliei]|uniref:MobH family relaxase n=1 Tax=Vibrio gangliei TaxID=2077090 RepID=UPI000D017393|nr:MobH family relaxase [Vibrio gangliei]